VVEVRSPPVVPAQKGAPLMWPQSKEGVPYSLEVCHWQRRVGMERKSMAAAMKWRSPERLGEAPPHRPTAVNSHQPFAACRHLLIAVYSHRRFAAYSHQPTVECCHPPIGTYPHQPTAAYSLQPTAACCHRQFAACCHQPTAVYSHRPTGVSNQVEVEHRVVGLRTNPNRVQIQVARRLQASACLHNAPPLRSVLAASRVPTWVRRTRPLGSGHLVAGHHR
jgi:hypothetical protein